MNIASIHSSKNILSLDESECEYHIGRIERSLLRLRDGQKVNLYSLRKRPSTIMIYLVVNKITDSISHYFNLYIDLIYSHFRRAESENELLSRYPNGSELNSSKFPPGTKLDGNYKLEIPESNRSFFNSSDEFQMILNDFNTNREVNVEIIYLAE